MSAPNYHPCPTCGQQNPTNATYCIRCHSPFTAAAPPASPPRYSSLYSPDMTSSVLKRIAGMALTVRICSALGWAFAGILFCAGIGSAVASMGRTGDSGPDLIPIIIGAVIGGVGGAFLGWLIASILVVWMEWAAQVLSALDDLAQR